MKTIVLVSPGQPSSNPRLQKEAVALFHAGYDVTVIYSFWVGWADRSDEKLFAQYPGIRWVRVGGHPAVGKVLYWYTRIRHKVLRQLAERTPSSRGFAERSLARAADELEAAAKRHPADLYIAHNLAALRPAARAAAKYNVPYAFDAEDYHRGQEERGSSAYRQTVAAEDHYLPGVVYCTAASPLIGAAYAKIYSGLKPVTVNNVFPIAYLQPVPTAYRRGGVVKLFWFSQTVGTGRGLEEAILAMGQITAFPVELTILGACSDVMEGELRELAARAGLHDGQLVFHGPVSLEEIFPIAHTHHIGLAMEVKTIENRRICLTNKIFTYLLSGLFIAASDTEAQSLFLEEHPGIGGVYTTGDAQALARLIVGAAEDVNGLNAARSTARVLAVERMNWEEEQRIFLDVVKRVLK